MLIAIISDTHLPRGSRRLPDACVDRIRAADLLIHAGDISTPEVLAELMELGPPVTAVHGNIDTPDLQRALPESLMVKADGRQIAVLHDAGPFTRRLERMRARFPDADAVIFGHSHIPLHEERDGFHIFNPGSPTDRRRQPRHTMGVAEVNQGTLAFRHLVVDPRP